MNTSSLLLVLALAAAGAAEETEVGRAADLAAPVPVLSDGDPISVDGFAAPFVGDFDEDGKHDLLVGQRKLGLLRIYRNVGTNARPKFDRFEWFTAGGRIAAVPPCCQVGFTPHLFDYDGDGRTDVLTGAFSGEAYVFRRNRNGTFAKAEMLLNKRGQLRMGRLTAGDRPLVSYNSTVFAHDWDGDGDADLLLRNCLVLNEGTRRQPVFGDARRIEIAGKRIYPDKSCMSDWDGDGKHDLIAKNGRDIVWCRNTGDNGQPAFDAPKVLVSTRDYADEPGWLHAFCVADFNGDGRLDLLVGDRDTVAVERSEQQEAEASANWAKRNDALSEYRSLIEGASREQQIEAARTALGKWEEFAAEIVESGQLTNPRHEYHGRVWLYSRLAPNDR